MLKIGGEKLLNRYGNSIPLLITSIFPEHKLLPWKFNLPFNFWKIIENQKQFVEWASEQLKIRELNDWYNVEVKVTSNA
jgi:hypothetical protein